MAAKEIIFSDVARSKLVEGVNILANAVKVTTGEPKLRSSTTLRPFGPSVTLTASRSPRKSNCRTACRTSARNS